MESTFQVSHYPEVSVVDRLSNFLKLSPERIAVWFQNRRARFKRAKKNNGAEENPPNLTEASMLKEVEELLFSSMGKSTTLDSEQTDSHLDKPKKKRPGKKPEYETFSQKQNGEENNSLSPISNINTNGDDVENDDEEEEEKDQKSPAKSPEIIIEAIVKPNLKHKPIFNPMSYEPSNNIINNAAPYSTYNSHEAFSVNNLVNSNNNNNGYYSYDTNESLQHVPLKLPIYRKESQDSYCDSSSSRSLSPQNTDQDNESNRSESSSPPLTLDSSNKPDYNSNQSIYSNYNYSNNQNAFYQQQQNSSSSMAYYNYPHSHNSHFFQSYYNMQDFHNNQANAYFPNMYSQFSSNPIPTSNYN